MMVGSKRETATGITYTTITWFTTTEIGTLSQTAIMYCCVTSNNNLKHRRLKKLTKVVVFFLFVFFREKTNKHTNKQL